MNYHWTEPFRKDFKRLPSAVQSRFEKCLKLYESNSRHPSLRVKKMEGTDDIREMRITKNHRMTFQSIKDGLLLRRIGTHDILRTP